MRPFINSATGPPHWRSSYKQYSPWDKETDDRYGLRGDLLAPFVIRVLADNVALPFQG